MNQSSVNHFDEIDNYDDEIPVHIANYLLEVKTRKIDCLIRRYFNIDRRENDRLKGLDLGCGTGGYIDYLQNINSELAIDGLDFSKKQLDHVRAKGLTNRFIHSSMSKIDELSDETYDFAYAINSIHHLPSKEEQRKALAEIFRILIPGGLFVIHEINIKNPFYQILCELYSFQE